MDKIILVFTASTILFLAMSTTGVAQSRDSGSAVVRVEDSEYLIPIECNDAAEAGRGFSTEPSRITRERTGRSSGVRLTLRPWKETQYLVVSLDRYVAWIPKPALSGSVLELALDMSPASSLVGGIPQALTFDRWMSGVRPEGLRNVNIEADCSSRNSDAPAYRKIPTGMVAP